MESYLSQSNVMFVVGILGVIFGVYKYFRDPQIKADKHESLLALQFSQLREEFANLRDNHLHTIETKIDLINTKSNNLALQVEHLSTIIEERIPARKPR